MNDWRKPCEHGRYESHIEWWGSLRGDECPGGSPVTTADLEGLGEKRWVCDSPFAPLCSEDDLLSGPEDWHDDCGYRLLIPIPDPQPATEGFVDNENADFDD